MRPCSDLHDYATLEPAARCLQRYSAVRAYTESLASHLSAEDQCIQSMPDASPVKWHRGHTTWFFEQFVLSKFGSGYQPLDPRHGYIFNSYYNAVGAQYPQAKRGLLSRPTVEEITEYRRHVDTWMIHLLSSSSDAALLQTIELGLQHEQQHQELIVTDFLHTATLHGYIAPFLPNWREGQGTDYAGSTVCAPGIVEIGHSGDGFFFDNEAPRHRTLLYPYRLATHLVRNCEWLEFITDDGYQTPSLWMSDGWAQVAANGWTAPLHWYQEKDQWMQAGPAGVVPLMPHAPVRHISWYEADAFARWANARLPTEEEWEAASGTPAIQEMTRNVWQWTGSPYRPYPGYRPAPGAIGEYNGKFMINQMVLRGGSSVTPLGHERPTYRNFFYPHQRWQFAGVRLAYDL